MKLVLFDCDGTLSDSFGLICEVMRRTFLAHGLVPPADEATHAIIGLSLDRAILTLHPACSAEDIPALVEDYRRIFHETRADPAFREALFDGISELLAALTARSDVRLGMVTGKTQRGVRVVVAAHGLEGTFSAVRTADDCPSKPHPAMVLECCAELGVAPADTLVIGDAIYDIQMALSAGAEAIGVSWGAGSPELLLGAGALSVAADVAELRRSIDRWLETGASSQPLAVSVS